MAELSYLAWVNLRNAWIQTGFTGDYGGRRLPPLPPKPEPDRAATGRPAPRPKRGDEKPKRGEK